MKRTAKILLALGGIFLILILGLFIWYFSVTAGVNLDQNKLVLSFQAVRIFDGEGNELEKTNVVGKREAVPFEKLPKHLLHAFISVEDKRFFQHNGLEYGRILKATVKNLLSRSFREGASTISQQLIKNTHLSGEKTLTRKLKEVKLTRQLEKRYSKEQILELYLNSIYFGHSAFGVAHASRFYFGKSADELNLAESAMLAGIVKSPNRYSPFHDGEKCLSRRNFVLSLMQQQGYLTESEYERAKAEALPTTSHEKESESAYFAQVYRELSEIFPDAGAQELRGMRVYTAYSPKIQAKLQQIQAESDFCYLVCDNTQNAIKALHSSVGLLKRLPASTLKPLLVYAPAVEENLLTPATPILDEKVNFSGYSPSNYGGGFGGYMSARYALSHSVNVPAVKILNSLGCERGANYLEKMGMRVTSEDKTLALALGGMKEGFTLLQLSNGYSTLANGGVYSPASAILRIEREDGTVLYTQRKIRKRVYSEETSAIVNDMLKTCAQEGTAKKLRSLPFPVCAKTGTGGTEGGNRDAYTIAYTADDVVSVWLGNRDNTPIQATGGGLPADCALKILQTIYQDAPPTPFPDCNGVCYASLDKNEYEENRALVLADQISPPEQIVRELFKRDFLPTSQSTRFSCPTIKTPRIFVKNGAIQIELCQTEYYDYVIKRHFEGENTIIYRGKYCKTVTDNSAQPNRAYVYSVQPFYKNHAGIPVKLPSVYLSQSDTPSDWWQ